jgi:hypothetical protein
MLHCKKLDVFPSQRFVGAIIAVAFHESRWTRSRGSNQKEENVVLNELTHSMVRNGAVFPVEEKYLKKGINPHDFLKSISRIKAVVADEGSLDILKDISD